MYTLGIPAKTATTKVAPGQFELAPFFVGRHVALNHQQLTMNGFAEKYGPPSTA